jgi:predicted nucleic acid-binding protein
VNVLIDFDIRIEVSRGKAQDIVARWMDLSQSELSQSGCPVLYSPVSAAELWAGALIASAATLHHATLWTRNRKHYPIKELSFF